MANFVRVWPAGLFFNQVPGSANLTLLDLQVSQAINGDGGGTWAPSTPIIIGGAGLQSTVSFSATGTAPNGHGVTGVGIGTGRGGAFQGGATGAGVLAQGGGGNAPGIQAQADGTGPAVECLVGGVKYTGTQPAVDADPGTNTTHATGACKAWALITTDGAGNVTVIDGLNIDTANVTIVSTVLTIPLVNGFASTAYAVFPSSGNTPVSAESVVYEWNRAGSTGTNVVLYGRRITSGAVTNVDFTATVNTILVQVMGRQ